MAEQQRRPLVKWVDLEPHDAQLAALRFPDGKMCIVLVGLEEGSADWRWACETQGFKPSISGTFLYREGARIDVTPFLRHFPQAQRVEWPANKIIRVAKTRKQSATPLDAEVRGARPLGLNHLGQHVFEGATGRFVRADESGTALTESEINSPAVFLRAKTAEDLAQCADGLVETMMRGAVLRADDLRRFAGVINDLPTAMTVEDTRLRGVQEAVEAALQRRLQREVVVPDKQAFDLAVRMVERQPPMIYRTSGSVENQQYSSPLPLAIAVQHMLGETARKKILEPTIGNCSLVSSVSADAVVTGIEIDPQRVEQARNFRPNVQVVQGDFTQTAIDHDFDLVIANPPFGGLKPETSIEGLRVSRIDHLILMRSLLARKADGRAVYIIGADRQNVQERHAGMLAGGSQNLFNWLADHYELDGVAEVDGRLYEKQGSGYPIRIVAVGRRLTPAETLDAQKTKSRRFSRVDVLRSWEAVWEFASAHRPEQEVEVSDATVPSEASESPEREQQRENDYQAPYVPASRIGESNAMIPRNLVAPTSQALDALEGDYGNIDEFVANRLEMTEVDLAAAFSPEQVDAIALAIARAEAGRGLILGDQTGLGKGRVLAGLARYAALQGRPVTFLTEKPNLFSDFYRDLQDIGSATLFRPLILNDGVDIRDQANKRVVPPSDKGTVRAMVDAMERPEDHGFNLTFATYSQFNRRSEASAKSLWLTKAAADGALLILDESHNAAGESNTALNVAAAVESAWACGYSSATFAKNAKNMSAYAKAFPKGMSAADIAETLEAGGEPLQEVLSAMLAEDGALVRREHDLSQLTFETVVDEGRRDRNEALADQLSEILQVMSAMSGDVEKIVGRMQKQIAADLKKLSEEQRKGNRMGVSYANFGSRLYNLLRQFQLALKVDMAADLAVKSLHEGRKPVIVVEQTMESLLKEAIFKPDDLEIGEDGELLEAPKLREAITLPPVTYRDALLRTLDRLDKIVLKNAYGNVETTSAIAVAENEEQARAWARLKDSVRRMIMDFPDLPLSPLDSIRERIERAGFECGEISGRSLAVSTTDDGMIVVQPRPDDRLRTIHEFNNGAMDSVILTRAGSTGLSLHASSKFLDQRQRVLIELQIANNVAERIQFFGRVNRKGQVSAPRIVSLASGLPGEMRVLSMQNNKLRKISANTQSNRSNAAEMKEVPDILNKLGSEICLRYLENNPEVANRLRIELDGMEDRMAENPEWLANRLMGHISMLRIAPQKLALAQIFDEYDVVLKELDAIGENPFKSQEFEWGAKVVHREVLDGVETDHQVSPFFRPVYLTKIQYEREVQPYRFEEVSRMVAASQTAVLESGFIDGKIQTGQVFQSQGAYRLAIAPLIERINSRFEIVKQESLEASKFETMDAALSAEGLNPVKNAEMRRQRMLEIIPKVYPGAAIRLKGPDGEDVVGVVAILGLPKKGQETHAGKYEIRVAIPGEQRLFETTINSLMATGVETAWSWPCGARSAEAAFNNAPAGKITYSKALLDGNLFRAAQLATERGLGRTIIYTDEHGTRHRAVLIKASMDLASVREMPLRVESAEQAIALLERGVAIYGDPRLDATKGTVVVASNGRAKIAVPGTRAVGGAVFLNKEIIAVTGDFAGGRSTMSATFPSDRLAAVMGHVMRTGAFYVSAKNRDLLAGIKAEGLQALTVSQETKPAQRVAALGL